jgi:hypothetical protein
MSHWRGAARAVDAQIVKHLPDLLASKSDADTQRLACEILGNLVIHKSSGVVAMSVELYARIVSLLRYFHRFPTGRTSLIPVVISTVSSAKVHYPRSPRLLSRAKAQKWSEQQEFGNIFLDFWTRHRTLERSDSHVAYWGTWRFMNPRL